MRLKSTVAGSFAALIGVIMLVGCSTAPDSEPVQTAASSNPVLSAPKELAQSKFIRTLDDFEHSEFCAQYSCARGKTWTLKPSGVNHVFDTDFAMPDDEKLSVEVQTEGDVVNSFGTMFFEKDTLDDADFKLIATLLRSSDQTRKHDSVLAFVRKNIEIPTHQIHQGKSTTDGEFRVWAAKVIQQTVTIERLSQTK